MKRFFEKNGILVLFIATVIAITLCIVNFFSTNASPFTNLINTVLAPVRAGYTAVENWAEDWRDRFSSVDAYKEEISQLKRELAEKDKLLRQAEKDSEENRLLREVLNLRPQQEDYVYELAAVIEQGASNWESALTLNRGEKHGVEPGDSVMTETGFLVGVVSEVGSSWCKVLTVLDTEFTIGAKVFRTEEVCVAEGNFRLMPEGKLTARYLDPNSSITVGDLVVTSGLGEYYPPGLVIGAVESLKMDDSGLSLTATLTPKAELSELRQVLIVKDFTVVD